MTLGQDRKTLVIEHVARFRGRPGFVEQNIKDVARMDGSKVIQCFPQDPGQAGVAQKSQYASLLLGYDVRFSVESGSKIERAKPMSAQAEAGNIKVVYGNWTESFLDELMQFPEGKFMDQVDAASRAFYELVKYKQRLISTVPAEVIELENDF